MDEQIQSILIRLHQSIDDQGRQTEIAKLTQNILKSRRIARRRIGWELSQINLEIYQALATYIQTQIANQKLIFASEQAAKQWASDLLTAAMLEILTHDRLQAMAIAVSDLPTVSKFKFAIAELIEALKITQVLPFNSQSPIYQEALSKTLVWMSQNIHKFDPIRGTFVAWLNYRFSKFLVEAKRDQVDRFTQSSRQKVIRAKYRLSTMLKHPNLQFWTMLYLKNALSSKVLISALSLLLSFLVMAAQNPSGSEDLLFKLAQAELSTPAEVTSIEAVAGLSNLIQSEPSPSLSEQVYSYFEEDPDGYCQKSMKSYPDITFQMLALARLEGVSWQELATRSGAKITALSNFYQRSLSELAPQICRSIQSHSSLT